MNNKNTLHESIKELLEKGFSEQQIKDELSLCMNKFPSAKIIISKKDADFLIDLQHELINQDTDYQAAPRYWGIIETKEEQTDYGCGELRIFFGETVSTELMKFDDAKKFVEEAIYEDEVIEISKQKNVEDAWNRLDKKDVDDFVSFCKRMLNWKETRVVFVNVRQEVAQNAVFLTKRSCQQHIKNNAHHYSKPHTYAMTAWRNSELETLLDIITNIRIEFRDN